MTQKEIEGARLGGASLNVETFASIVNSQAALNF